MTIARDTLRWNGWGKIATHNPLEGRDAAWAWIASELGVSSLPHTPAKKLEELKLPASRLGEAAMAALERAIPSARIKTDPFERAFHARGKSYHDLLHLRAGRADAMPDVVVYPESTDQVLALLHWAEDQDAAIVPFGGGSSVVGGVTARAGARAIVVCDLTKMSKTGPVDRVSLLATAQAGIYGVELEKWLQDQGLTLGHYPQSFEFSTLGGWIAARGAGQQSNRYGEAEKWLVSAELATPRGLWRTEGFPASAAGPNLNQIVAGSEGAFGLITSATFKVHHAPQSKDYRAYLMRDFQSGAEAVRAIVQAEIPVATLRLSDADETHFFQAFAKAGAKPGLKDRLTQSALRLMGVREKPCLLMIGFEGDALPVRQARAAASHIVCRHHGVAVGESPAKRWYAGRFHGPYLRDPLMDRGIGVDTLETATRWSNIPALYAAVRDALTNACAGNAPSPGARGIVMGHISHAYPDGASLYFTFIFPRKLEDEIGQWQAIKRAASEAIVKSGGTISHHHGVGEDHLPWLGTEKGEVGMRVLTAIKRTLDPKGTMNPGKLLSASET